MDTDFKSLEKRYGTSLAMKISEEIARAEQKHNSFYRAHASLKALHAITTEDEFTKIKVA